MESNVWGVEKWWRLSTERMTSKQRERIAGNRQRIMQPRPAPLMFSPVPDIMWGARKLILLKSCDRTDASRMAA
jgi:hypothetical protein